MSWGSLVKKKKKVCDDVIKDHYNAYAQGSQMKVARATLILMFSNLSAWLCDLNIFFNIIFWL